MQSIKEEIKTNLIEVENKYEYHLKLLDNIEKNPLETILMIKSSRTEDYIWSMANNSIFKQHTNFDIYKKLAKIYSIQEVLKRHNMQTGEMMAYLNVTGPNQMLAFLDKKISEADKIQFQKMKKQAWTPLFQDMTYYESMLIKLYKEALLEIK